MINVTHDTVTQQLYVMFVSHHLSRNKNRSVKKQKQEENVGILSKIDKLRNFPDENNVEMSEPGFSQDL